MEGELLGKIRVAVAGVGNCCSALVQGVHFYNSSEDPVGLIHETVGGYAVSDIEFVSAFDIDRRKVGKDLSEAIFSAPNNAPRFVNLPHLGVPVLRGPVLDSVGSFTKDLIEVAEGEAADVAGELKAKRADVLINLISGGADKASRFYAEAALEAGCAFLNATPTAIASDAAWSGRFGAAGVPVAGDDLLDQVGATVVHMGLLEFLQGRGVHIDESFQLDVGGGVESLNTLERTRKRKRAIKTAAVAKAVPYRFPLVSGSTDYVDFLGNSRDSFFWIKGRYFGGAPFTMDVRLGTVDAPNAGAILLDVIRGLKLASARGMGGVILPLSAYAFKNPPERRSLAEAYELFREFISS
ncbi:inositol-3-phosphate synthase [Candidatus Bathyarchaeota archaeon]|nr:MAG: inositol-3-phosphate synthase [Candidatus Bathyarchaeota archaeon]